MKKIVIFDFDGTLADTFPITSEIFKTTIKEYGYKEISNEDIQKLREMTPIQIITHFKFPIWKVSELINKVRDKTSDFVDQIKPFKGINKMLHDLKKKNIKLGILTSNSKKTVEAFLEHKEFPKFEFIESELSIFKKSKHLKNLIRKYKFKKKDVIYIGDEVRDIEASREAGVDVIAVTWGYNKREVLQKHAPDYLVENPDKLRDYLETVG